ncbi:MAG: hypothetical protein LRY54_02575 [Alphaproteobacteria bacterium]|nr:hypothetical protein [Alphaproteobacteria bacterium]
MVSLSPFLLLTLFGFAFAIIRPAPVIRNYQPVFFALFNAAFLLAVMNVTAFCYLLGFVALGYAALWFKMKTKGKAFPVFLLALLALFALFKKYEFIPVILPPLEGVYNQIPILLGISYIIFRVINLLFEAHEKGEVPGPLSYFNFNLSFLTFLSGPIQRYKDFKADNEGLAAIKDRDEEASATALHRIANGAVKVMLLAPIFQSGVDYVTRKLANDWTPIIPGIPAEYDAAIGLSIAMVFFLIYLYFNFAGYTDIAIALGRLCGFKLPENFNKPFLTASFLDFWTHWHMSLSSWYKDFVFTPILKATIQAGIKNPVLAMVPAYFIAFGFVGVWHGRTWPFLFCGLMLALGAAGNHIYREWIAKKVFGKDGYKALKTSKLYLGFAGGLTLFYLAVSIIGLQWSGEQILHFIDLTSAKAITAAFILIIALMGAGLFMFRIVSTWRLYKCVVDKPVAGFFGGQSSFLLACKLFILLSCYLAFLTGVPGFYLSRVLGMRHDKNSRQNPALVSPDLHRGFGRGYPV